MALFEVFARIGDANTLTIVDRYTSANIESVAKAAKLAEPRMPAVAPVKRIEGSGLERAHASTKPGRANRARQQFRAGDSLRRVTGMKVIVFAHGGVHLT